METHLIAEGIRTREWRCQSHDLQIFPIICVCFFTKQTFTFKVDLLLLQSGVIARDEERGHECLLIGIVDANALA